MFAHRLIVQSGNKQEIIGITCVAGKKTIEEAVDSALVVNLLLGTNIPVSKGQSRSLLLRQAYPETYASQSYK